MSLTIQNLSKTYPNGVKAINNISIQIGKGMFGLLGPNGAGKSSLMRTIATLQKSDKGSIHFNGIDVLKDPMSLRKVLGYLPQDFGVYPKMSAEKLLDYFAVLKGISNKKDRQHIIEKVLALTNLEAVKTKHVSGYSGGMKQRFGIAQLLLNKPQLLIVDEPTAGLDPAERNRFLNVLRSVGTESTVIFSTHIVEDVKDLCNDMAIINQGQILKRTTPAAAISAMENKIWTCNISAEQLAVYKEQFYLLSSGFNTDNSLNVRVYSKEQPSEEFVLIQPTLEDVYFKELGVRS